MDKRGRLMKEYGWKPDYIRLELSGAQGWVWYNWSIENESSLLGERLERKTPGYVAQERERLLRWATAK